MKIKDLSKEVAEYFLEDVATFNLQEYLGIFARFAEQVKQAYEVSWRNYTGKQELKTEAGEYIDQAL